MQRNNFGIFSFLKLAWFLEIKQISIFLCQLIIFQDKFLKISLVLCLILVQLVFEIISKNPVFLNFIPQLYILMYQFILIREVGSFHRDTKLSIVTKNIDDKNELIFIWNADVFILYFL